MPGPDRARADGERSPTGRDRDPAGRARQARPRDALGRPLPYGDDRGVEPVSEEPQPPAEALAQAQALLDEGRAFSAHEILEAAWKAAPGPERELWQGLAQICVGVTHAHRGNRTGATRLVERGAEQLKAYAARTTGAGADGPHGIDISGLLRWCAANAGDPAGGDVPRLRVH